MKKFLALLLALTLAFSTVSCSLFANPEKDKAEVEATVKSFMDAYIALNFDGLDQYVVNKEDLAAKLAEVDLTAAFDTAMNDVPAEMEPYRQDLQKIFNDTIEKLKSKFSYTMVDAVRSEDGNEYTVTVDLNVPDSDSANLGDVFSESANREAITGIINEMISSGKITQSTTQDEMLALLMPEVMKLVETTINNLEIDVITHQGTLIVTKADDGKWLIDLEKSEFTF
ncbi:MAG: hypothetical protein IKM21_03805 [Oscillospiraceae bacterium]|nr:hypothetical protein [Oscillospiraceae bacterium]